MREFFTSKNESLAQAFVEVAYKGVVTTLVIGSIATFVNWRVEQSIETYQKRQALQNLQNERLSTSIEALANGLQGDLTCATETALVVNAECRNHLSEYHSMLRAEQAALEALFPNEKFDCFTDMVNTVESLRKTASEGPGNSTKIRDEISHYENSLREAITELAATYK